MNNNSDNKIYEKIICPKCKTEILLQKCSFCGKHKRHIKKLIEGKTAYICNECVLTCVEILMDSNPSKANTDEINVSNAAASEVNDENI